MPERAKRARQIDRPSFKEGHYSTVGFWRRLGVSNLASPFDVVSVPGCAVEWNQGRKVNSKVISDMLITVSASLPGCKYCSLSI